jgi:phosphatidylinositol 4-kinase
LLQVPILVAFNVIPHTHPADTSHPDPGTAGSHSPAANGDGGSSSSSAAPGPVPPTQKMACIFKVGDDIRQDVLAIQVITLLRDAFERAGLGLYLRPYGCLPTGYECGIIEVVPNCKSRAALGELSDRGLYDIFTAEFGAPGSAAFERARFNFIVSEAAYAVASYLLQVR